MNIITCLLLFSAVLRPLPSKAEPAEAINDLGSAISTPSVHYEPEHVWETEGNSHAPTESVSILTIGPQLITEVLTEDLDGRIVSPYGYSGFGMKVAMSNKTAMISDDGKGLYVYEFEFGKWVFKQSFDFQSSIDSIAIDNGTALIGICALDKAIVYVKRPSGWVEQQTLKAADGVSGDCFGGGVALSGEHALVAAHRADIMHPVFSEVSMDAGAVYVFARSGPEWTQQAKLTDENPVKSDFFGLSITLRGDVAAILKNRDKSTQLFESGVPNWSHTGMIPSPDKEIESCINGCPLAVLEDELNLARGSKSLRSAFISDIATGTLKEELKASDDTQYGQSFGRALATSGNLLLVADHESRQAAYSGGVGAAYVYYQGRSGWVQLYKLQYGSLQSKSLYGYSVALDGNIALIGAPAMWNQGYSYGRAYFYTLPWPVEVTKQGTGSGGIKSSTNGYSGGISCGDKCLDVYRPNTQITLTATADAGSAFTGWGGACESYKTASTCSITINEVNDIVANFSLSSTKPTLNVSTTGLGVVTSHPAGINCQPTCRAVFDKGQTVTLTAKPGNGSVFSGWSGSCGGAGACEVALQADQTVSATFTSNPGIHSLTVNKTGEGTITSTPFGIDCGSTCSASFNAGVPVTLTPTAGPGYTFSGWGGACSGTGNCVVNMDANQTVTALFVEASITKHILKVAKFNSGLVTSEPGGIACGGRQTACTALFSSVTLTAYPNPGNFVKKFVGCPNSIGPTCSFTLTRPTTVKAVFAKLPKYALKIVKTKNGEITSEPAGLKCKAAAKTCSFSFVSGTRVTLNPIPAPGYNFTGWSGLCTGTGTCEVLMDAKQSVGAQFE